MEYFPSLTSPSLLPVRRPWLPRGGRLVGHGPRVAATPSNCCRSSQKGLGHGGSLPCSSCPSKQLLAVSKELCSLLLLPPAFSARLLHFQSSILLHPTGSFVRFIYTCTPWLSYISLTLLSCSAPPRGSFSGDAPDLRAESGRCRSLRSLAELLRSSAQASALLQETEEDKTKAPSRPATLPSSPAGKTATVTAPSFLCSLFSLCGCPFSVCCHPPDI